jgi:hypothetical protein
VDSGQGVSFLGGLTVGKWNPTVQHVVAMCDSKSSGIFGDNEDHYEEQALIVPNVVKRGPGIQEEMHLNIEDRSCLEDVLWSGGIAPRSLHTRYK